MPNWSSNGSGNSSSAAPSAQWWTCGVEGCVQSLKDIDRRAWTNKPSDVQCGHCGLPWNYKKQVGESKLAAARQQLQEKLAAVEGTAAANSTSLQVALPKGPPLDFTDGDNEEEEVLTTTRLELPQEYVVIAQLLKPPRELPADWSAEAAFSKFLPRKTVPDADKLGKDVQDQRVLLDLQTRKLAQGDAGTTRKKLEALEKHLEKASSYVEGTLKLAACELELGLHQYEEAEKSRVGRTDASAEKATERAERLEAICLEQITAWETHLDQLRVDRTAREAEWESRRLWLENRSLEVAALATTKIEEANLRAGTSTTPQNTAPTFNLQLADATAEVARLKKEASAVAEQTALEKKSLLERLEALEARASAPAAPAAAPTATLPTIIPTMTTGNSKRIRYDKGDIVVLKRTVNAEEKAFLAHIMANIETWIAHGLFNISMTQLSTGCHDVSKAHTLVQQMAGETIWGKFVEAGHDMATTSAAPAQLASVLQAVTIKLDKDTRALVTSLTDSKNEEFQELEVQDTTHQLNGTGPYASNPF